MDGTDSDVLQLTGEFCRVGSGPVSAPGQLCPLSEPDRHELFPLDVNYVVWKIAIMK